MSRRALAPLLAAAFARIDARKLAPTDHWTVGSWRDDAEFAPIRDDDLAAIVLPNGTRIYPRWLDQRNGWLMPESWD